MSHVPLTEKYLHALRAVALGKVFRTYNSTEFKITGPCSSKLLWSLARMDLIADPPGGPLQGCHCMMLTAEGMVALGMQPEIDSQQISDRLRERYDGLSGGGNGLRAFSGDAREQER